MNNKWGVIRLGLWFVFIASVWPLPLGRFLFATVLVMFYGAACVFERSNTNIK